MEGGDAVRKGIVKAFKELLFDPRDWRANLDGINLTCLNEIDAART